MAGVEDEGSSTEVRKDGVRWSLGAAARWPRQGLGLQSPFFVPSARRRSAAERCRKAMSNPSAHLFPPAPRHRPQRAQQLERLFTRHVGVGLEALPEGLPPAAG